MKVSVIIPVYNAEDSIRETLTSVMSQACDEMEIILIDDCSADRSADVVRETAAGDPRVTLITNSCNMGVSAARNKGLDAATGEYIRFVDDDDPLPEGSISSMLEVAEVNDSDLVIGIMERVRLGRTLNIVATAALGSKKVIDKYDPDLTQNFSVCNKMFRLDIIKEHGVAFRAYRHAEDGLFLFEYLQYAEKINGCDKVIYSYRRPDTLEGPTATTRIEGTMLRDIVEIAGRILGMHADAPDEFVEQFNRKIASSILIEKCYRKLWRLNDPDASFLLEQLAEYRGRLSQVIWDDVRSKHLDLCLDKGFFNKEEAAENAVFTIAVADSLDPDDVIRLMHSAYYQRSLLFRIVLPEKYRGILPDELGSMPNIVFDGSDQTDYGRMIETCDTTFITFVEDPVIFTFDTLFWAASLMQDEETAYVSGLCQREGEEKIITPEAYRFAFTKENLGISEKYTAADSADPLLSNKIFRTEKLRDFVSGNGGWGAVTIRKIAGSLRHERSRKTRYMTTCSDPYLRRKLIGTKDDESLISVVRLEQGGGRPLQGLRDKVLFVSEKQEMKPAFQKLYKDLKHDKEVFVREAEPDADARLQKYSGYRTLLFERYDPALTESDITVGQNCYVLVNYLCRDKASAPFVFAELNDTI